MLKTVFYSSKIELIKFTNTISNYFMNTRNDIFKTLQKRVQTFKPTITCNYDLWFKLNIKDMIDMSKITNRGVGYIFYYK